jgi:hypothetical protein
MVRPTVRGARDVAALRDWLLRAWRASGNDGWGALALRALRDAALWYVPADTIDLASAAAGTLPADVVLDHHLTPPGACFIYCKTSLLTRADTQAVLVHPVTGAEYAVEGVVEVETGGHHLLPPQQAIWIAAGLPHRTTLRRVRAVSVFFAPEMLTGRRDRVRVLPAEPVVREMILYGARWPITRAPAHDPTADAYFRALALIVGDLLDHGMPLWLPTSRTRSWPRRCATHAGTWQR